MGEDYVNNGKQSKKFDTWGAKGLKDGGASGNEWNHIVIDENGKPISMGEVPEPAKIQPEKDFDTAWRPWTPSESTNSSVQKNDRTKPNLKILSKSFHPLVLADEANLAITLVAEPEYMQLQAKEAVLYCKTISASLQKTNQSIEDFVQENQLTGEVYDNAKSFFSETLQVLIKEMVLVLEDIQEIHANYPNQYNAEVDDSGAHLDEARLEIENNHLESIIRRSNEQHHRLSNNIGKNIFNAEANSLKKLKQTNEELLQKLRMFDSNHAHAFADVKSRLRKIKNGLAVLTKHADVNSRVGTFDLQTVQLDWAREMKEDIIDYHFDKATVKRIEGLGYQKGILYGLEKSANNQHDKGFLKIISSDRFDNILIGNNRKSQIIASNQQETVTIDIARLSPNIQKALTRTSILSPEI